MYCSFASNIYDSFIQGTLRRIVFDAIKRVVSRYQSCASHTLMHPAVKNTCHHCFASPGILGTSGPLWQEQRRFVLQRLRDRGFGKSSYEPIMIQEVAELMEQLAKEESKPLEMEVGEGCGCVT